MARLDEHTSLIVVKEGNKLHLKIYYSRDGIKRYKTNVYVKDKAQFMKDRGFRKSNAVSPETFQEDKARLNDLQLKIETIIDDFLREHLVKPTAAQLDTLLETYKESSQKSYTYVCDYLEEYTGSFDRKERNSKSVVRALGSALTQFWSFNNRKYFFNEIDYKFINEFVDFLLFHKPKRQTCEQEPAEPSHRLTTPVTFDQGFGMNNNTLLKRLDAFRSFIIWAINTKGVNIDYNKVKEALKRVAKDRDISGYSNVEFAFRTMEDVKLLASMEFEESIKDDTYPEHINGVEKSKGVSRNVLIRAKDFFVISVLTGNRVSDLRAIRRHHVDLGKQTAKKTKGQFLLNSNKSVVALLEKYDYNMNLSDAKYNKCIKVVLKQFYTDYLQRHKRVYVVERRGEYEQVQEVEYYTLASSHSGRRSFATINYHSNTKSKRAIMQFTGHTSEKEFDKYIQLTPEDDIKDFAVFMSL